MGDSSSAGIEEFWSFWGEHRGALERAIEEGALDEWLEPVQRAVSRIHPELDWEFGPGRAAQHYFCLAPKGNAELRVLTERWRSRGPADDAVFEYHAARPGGRIDQAFETLDFEGRLFALSDFRIAIDVDEDRERLHLKLWHPSYEDAPDELRWFATYVALDTTLGEDEVERWVGRVEVLDRNPEDAGDFTALFDAVKTMKATATGERFAILKAGLPSGATAIATVNLAIKRVDHLLMDIHVEVTMSLLEPRETGFPGDTEAERLNGAEDALCESLGPDAVYIGRETLEGRRVLHWHVASAGPAMARIDEWASAQPWPIEVHAHHDPSWSILKRW